MVEVFKTNVQRVHESKKLLKQLAGCFSTARINFDIQDCDRILRIEDVHVPVEDVIRIIRSYGYHCSPLD